MLVQTFAGMQRSSSEPPCFPFSFTEATTAHSEALWSEYFICLRQAAGRRTDSLARITTTKAN